MYLAAVLIPFVFSEREKGFIITGTFPVSVLCLKIFLIFREILNPKIKLDMFFPCLQKKKKKG